MKFCANSGAKVLFLYQKFIPLSPVYKRIVVYAQFAKNYKSPDNFQWQGASHRSRGEDEDPSGCGK
jgi:hypothetical protein